MAEGGAISRPSLRSLFTAAIMPILLSGCGATLQLPFKVAAGQHFEATVTREQRFSQGGEELLREQAAVPVQIQVIAENDEGFVFVWHYGCLKSDRVDSPRSYLEQRIAGIGTGLLLLEGFDLHIQTDEYGRPRKLLNRFELRAAVLKRVSALRAELQRAAGKDPVVGGPYERLFYEIESHDRFYAQEANLQVEMEILSDVLLLSAFNGEALPLGHRDDYTRQTFSPIHAAPITTTGHVAIADLDETAQKAWIEWGTSVDSESYKESLAYAWAAYRAGAGAEAASEEMPDFDIRHFGVFEVDLATGQTRDARIEQRSSVEGELLQKITRVVQEPVANGRVIPKSKRTPAACRPRPKA